MIQRDGRQRRVRLTSLPSFCQKMAGGGLPVASHWKTAILPTAPTWFLGRMAKAGGTAGGKAKIINRYISNYTAASHISPPLHPNSINFFSGNFAITFLFQQEDKTRITYSMDGWDNSAREENNSGLMGCCSCLMMDVEWMDGNLPALTKKRGRDTQESSAMSEGWNMEPQ